MKGSSGGEIQAVIELDARYEDEVVALLVAAFEHDPGWLQVSGAPGEDHRRCLETVYRASWTLYRAARQPLLGVMAQDRLAGVAMLNVPGAKFAEPARRGWAQKVRRSVGDTILSRLLRNAREVARHRPEEPHLYLGTLAVRPDLQGSGIGRLLLESVSERSDRDPAARGVFLETENPKNVPLYEHFGYRIVGRYHYDQIKGTAMFHPCPVGSPGGPA